MCVKYQLHSASSYLNHVRGNTKHPLLDELSWIAGNNSPNRTVIHLDALLHVLPDLYIFHIFSVFRGLFFS